MQKKIYLFSIIVWTVLLTSCVSNQILPKDGFVLTKDLEIIGIGNSYSDDYSKEATISRGLKSRFIHILAHVAQIQSSRYNGKLPIIHANDYYNSDYYYEPAKLQDTTYIENLNLEQEAEIYRGLFELTSGITHEYYTPTEIAQISPTTANIKIYEDAVAVLSKKNQNKNNGLEPVIIQR